MTQTPSPPEGRWALPLSIALFALALRFLLIAAFPDGRDDLAIYVYFGRLFRDGVNPYLPPFDGPISLYADQPFLNLTLFAAALRVWDSPTVLRILFALGDAALILTLGLLVNRPQRWRLHAMLFWAFNPVVLLSMVVFTVDKVIVTLLLVLTVVALEVRRPLASMATTTLVTLYRWLGIFYVLPQVLYLYRTWRARLLALVGFGLIFAAVHLPWFPSSLLMYQNRALRTQIDPPIHLSPTILLSSLGLYAPWMVSAGVLLVVGILYVQFVRRRVALIEVILLSSFFTTMLTPELPMGRILMVAFPLLLLLQVSRRRMAALWLATLPAALVANGYLTPALLEMLRLPPIPAGNALLPVLLANAFAALLLLFYLLDRRRGLVPQETLLPVGALRAPWSPAAPAHAAPANAPHAQTELTAPVPTPGAEG
jgi:hypothetical protein